MLSWNRYKNFRVTERIKRFKLISIGSQKTNRSCLAFCRQCYSRYLMCTKRGDCYVWSNKNLSSKMQIVILCKDYLSTLFCVSNFIRYLARTVLRHKWVAVFPDDCWNKDHICKSFYNWDVMILCAVSFPIRTLEYFVPRIGRASLLVITDFRSS